MGCIRGELAYLRHLPLQPIEHLVEGERQSVQFVAISRSSEPLAEILNADLPGRVDHRTYRLESAGGEQLSADDGQHGRNAKRRRTDLGETGYGGVHLVKQVRRLNNLHRSIRRLDPLAAGARALGQLGTCFGSQQDLSARM